MQRNCSDFYCPDFTMKAPIEVQFAQKLAANEPGMRNKAVKKLKKWFSARQEPFSEPEMMRLWKGLYYCFWMSDKPLVQEELAENISSFVSCFKSPDSALLFVSDLSCTHTLRLTQDEVVFAPELFPKQSDDIVLS